MLRKKYVITQAEKHLYGTAFQYYHICYHHIFLFNELRGVIKTFFYRGIIYSHSTDNLSSARSQEDEEVNVVLFFFFL